MIRIDQILAARRQEMELSKSLQNRYEDQLLKNFPTPIPEGDLFHKNTFTGNDEEDYKKSVSIFINKSWNEVSFDSLYTDHVQFLMLTPEGKYYYLPAFLKNFYDLRFFNIEFFTYFLGDLLYGFSPSSSEKDISSESTSLQKTFERINTDQSKLVAMFLVNVANLMPPNSHEATQAQAALTIYWGHFLVF